MLAVIAVDGTYQRHLREGHYEPIADLAKSAQDAADAALALPPGISQHEALLEAAALCLAARKQAMRLLNAGDISPVLHRLYDALSVYERIPPELTFERLHGSRDDRALYQSEVVPGMSAEDVHATDGFFERLNDGRLIAWWLMHGETVLGWCALAPDHGRYQPGAYHLYGSWVRQNERRRGYARLMWLYRMHTVPRLTPITTSVQHGKVASLRLVDQLGFRPIGTSGPWTNYVHDH